MAFKVYLSPAAHEHDNPCSFDRSNCGENVHCNLYMDELEPILIACGFNVRRNPKNRTGNRLHEAIDEANAWGADLYYVCHTNAGGGAYSKIMVYDKGIGYTYAEKIKAQEQAVYTNSIKITVEPQWAEISQTHMPCVYHEMVFHDNINEITYFHNHFRNFALAIAKGICDCFGVTFVNPYKNVTPVPTPAPTPIVEQIYRIRTLWDDAKSQIGAYKNLDSAKNIADSRAIDGYKVFDNDGKVVYAPATPTPAPTYSGLYRVRLTWSDAKSQIGAYANLDGAKSTADTHASEGYKVFDSNGNIVYTPSTPAPSNSTPVDTPKPDPTPQPVTVEKHPIMGTAEVMADQMATYVLQHNATPSINCDIYALAQLFLSEGAIEGVRGDIAFAQSIHETGFFRYGGDVKPEQNNFAGIGATGAVHGASFVTPQLGIRAQIQHLKAYASKEALKQDCVDPRYSLVTKGICPNLEDLAGHWAVPGYDKNKYESLDAALIAGESYGQYIWNTVEAMKNTIGISKPIPDPVVEPTTTPTTETPVTEPNNTTTEAPVNTTVSTSNTSDNQNKSTTQSNENTGCLTQLINLIINMVISLFKKK